MRCLLNCCDNINHSEYHNQTPSFSRLTLHTRSQTLSWLFTCSPEEECYDEHDEQSKASSVSQPRMWMPIWKCQSSLSSWAHELYPPIGPKAAVIAHTGDWSLTDSKAILYPSWDALICPPNVYEWHKTEMVFWYITYRVSCMWMCRCPTAIDYWVCFFYLYSSICLSQRATILWVIWMCFRYMDMHPSQWAGSKFDWVSHHIP